MKATLTKVANLSTAHADANHTHPVTTPQEIEFEAMPKVGDRFFFTRDGRFAFTTTPVKEAQSFRGGMLFKTENTEYQLVLDAGTSH
ncbi:hypothetical protein [Myxococcus phage Mx1]|nr:hypothetical protein [Myxococcus phage Mx1]